MSNAANHAKRSHRSESFKHPAYKRSRTVYNRSTRRARNRGIFNQIAYLFHRRAMSATQQREGTE